MLQGLFCKRINNNNNNNSNSNVPPPRRAGRRVALAHQCNNNLRAARAKHGRDFRCALRAVAVARLLCSAYVRVQTTTARRPPSVERYVRATEHAVLSGARCLVGGGWGEEIPQQNRMGRAV